MSEPKSASGEDGAPGTAATLRAEFDAAFAAPALEVTDPPVDVLAIRVGSDPFALRLAEIAGLHAHSTIVPLPAQWEALIGIVGIRGALRPIYDLAALLGYGASASPRWLIFPQAAPSVGLAFAALESHLKVPRSTIEGGEEKAENVPAGREFTRGVARVGGALRPVIHLESVVKVIKERAP